MSPHSHDHHGHDHSHGHDHRHHHHGADGGVTRSLKIALVITVILFVGELVGGWLTHSLALLADAGHVFTDGAALVLSLFVAWLARQPGGEGKTYGYLRWEILAALFNAATLLLVSGWIVVEAIMRFRNPEPIHGAGMLWVAVAGLVANGAAVKVLEGSHKHNLNVRAAYLHILGDLLAAVGTVIAAIFVRYAGWLGADPAASILTTLLIVVSAWRLLRESVDVLLEAAPSHLSMEEVRKTIAQVDGVESVHDLHVWTLTSGVVAASAHVIVRQYERHQEVLQAALAALQAHGINHATLQLERSEMDECEPLHP
jgi:cobalt-zinc-cadmium efflux system protein